MTRPVARRPNILLNFSDQHSPHLAGFAGNRVIDADDYLYDGSSVEPEWVTT